MRGAVIRKKFIQDRALFLGMVTTGVSLLAALFCFYCRIYWQSELIAEAEPTGNRLIQDFLNSELHGGDIDLSELSTSAHLTSLFDPMYLSPTTFQYDWMSIHMLVAYAENCDLSKISMPKLDRNLRKAFLWHKFLCGHEANLPENFFQDFPFIHPGGQSFAYRAYGSEHTQFKTAPWLTRHLKFFHISELATLPSFDHLLTKDQRLALSIPGRVLRKLLRRDLFATSGPYVFIRKNRPDNSKLIYLKIDQEDWQRFLERKHLRINTDDRVGACFGDMQSYCLSKDQDSLRSKVKGYRITTNVFASIFVLGLLWLCWCFYRRQEKARKAQIFMLSMLTHELRTPATSLQLSLEAMRPHFDFFPDLAQDGFLQMCGDIQRLNRLIVASAQYLANLQGSSVLKFNFQENVDVVHFIQSSLEDFNDSIQFRSSKDEVFLIKTDLYWLKFCIHNLLSNACKYGVPPIYVDVGLQNNRVTISIQDQGNLPEDFGRYLGKLEFKQTSNGLGIGLSLTSRIIKELGGELSFAKSPSTLCISIPRQKS